MTSLTISIPDEMKEFVDGRIGVGKFPDASAYLQFLIAEEMECAKIDFSPEQKEHIDHLLLEAVDELDAGKCAPWQPGEALKILDEAVRRH